MELTFYPTAGYTPLFGGPDIVPLTKSEKKHLRQLAKKVIEIANDDTQEEKRNLWYAHNRLEKTRPLVLLFPENSWAQFLGEDKLKIKSPFWIQWEWYLHHLIYRSQNFSDDFVIEPDIYVNKIIRTGGWGVDFGFTHGSSENGSWVYDPPLKNPDDIKKLTLPTIEIDEEQTLQNFNAVSEVLGDLFNIHLHCQVPAANLISEATMFRGIQQVMLDIYDRPKWLHELMTIISEGVLKQAEYLEENGHLTLNNRNHYTDTGGIGYTDELGAKHCGDKKIMLSDLWGLGVAQELSEVGAEQHQEFVLDYQLKILEKFGLVSYGCCEPLTRKFDMVRTKIPRLRRVSISPWCDSKVAAAELEDKYIYSWKYNPAKIAGTFETNQIRADIQEILDITKDCVLEIILKDTITVENEPQRLNIWSQIVMDEILSR